MTPFRLSSLPVLARLGIAALLSVVLIGLGASAIHLYWHLEKRDERPGFTYDDVAGAYHGITTVAPLRVALERGHPETLAPEKREALLDWLLGKKDAQGRRPGTNARLSDDYDNPDLGARSPAEIITSSCLECHARKAASAHPIANSVPLETWDDVKAVSITRDVKPTDPKKLATSVHAHALSLGCLSLVLSLMLCASRVPRFFAGGLIVLTGLGLLADFAGQLLARQYEPAVGVLIAGGMVYNGASVLTVLTLIGDLLVPCCRKPAP